MKRNPKRNLTGKKKSAGRGKKAKKAMPTATKVRPLAVTSNSESVAVQPNKGQGLFSRAKSRVKNMTPEQRAALKATNSEPTAVQPNKGQGLFSRAKSRVKNMTPEQRAAIKAKLAERRRAQMSADQQIATAPVSNLRPNY